MSMRTRNEKRKCGDVSVSAAGQVGVLTLLLARGDRLGATVAAPADAEEGEGGCAESRQIVRGQSIWPWRDFSAYVHLT